MKPTVAALTAVRAMPDVAGALRIADDGKRTGRTRAGQEHGEHHVEADA